MEVKVQTVALADLPNNSFKFYRTYVFGTTEVRQYGRIGSVGQFEVKSHSTHVAARYSADEKIDEKVRKGYTSIGRIIEEFNFPLVSKFHEADTPKDGARLLAHAFESTGLHGADVASRVNESRGRASDHSQGRAADIGRAPSTPVQVVNPIQALVDKYLVAINLSFEDTAKASSDYVLLDEELKALKEEFKRVESYRETLAQMVAQ